MRIRHSLRWRVAAGVALFTILVVAVNAVALYLATEHQEEQFIDYFVSHEMQELVAAHARDPQMPALMLRGIRGYVVRNDAERRLLPESLRSLPIGVQEVFADKIEWHVQVYEENATRFYVAYDVQHHEDRLAEFANLLWLSVAVAAVLSWWLGYWLAGMLTRPVSALAQRVDGLARGAAPELAPSFGDEEVQRLANAFDAYVARVGELLSREREFTANVSHELRSPLQALRTGCELLLQDSSLSAASHERLLRNERMVERMSAIVQALLFLARVEERAEVEDVVLCDCLDEAAEPLRERLAQKAVSFDVAVDPQVRVRANRTALYMILANLVKNALDYTDSGRICVAYGHGRLVVEDSGRGIPESELPRIFDRFYRGVGDVEGFGVGLAIVKRLCDRYGWALSVESRVGAGTRVTLDFGPVGSQ
jgi:signal transduction histidine kinase